MQLLVLYTIPVKVNQNLILLLTLLSHCKIEALTVCRRICAKKVSLFTGDPHISAGTTWLRILARNLCTCSDKHARYRVCT